MSKKKTTEEFIQDAKKIHGDFYDYSLVNYQGNKIKIEIICPIHGSFEQKPNDHLNGKGCPKCQYDVSNNTNNFIKKAKEVHKSFYDYSQVNYQGNSSKVKIICPDHGAFWQTPKEHLKGQGCKQCGREKSGFNRRKTTEEFIQKAQQVHGDYYDYSEVEYVNNSTKVKIICPIHGAFWQIPNSHLNGSGCKSCKHDKLANITRATTEQFIKEAKEVHGEYYDYSEVEYINNCTKVKIICPKHGAFWQKPNDHTIRGNGCSKCFYENRKLTTEEFIQKAKEIHGDYYDYSEVEYIKSSEKVKIICPIHGAFFQKANIHLLGCNCPKCNNNVSKGELQVKHFLEELGLDVETSRRDIITPYEIDLYVPEKNIGIEFDGLYWHSEKFFKEKTYHLNKTQMAEQQNIQLVHIFEDEWNYQNEIVKKELQFLLDVNNDLTLNAINCEVNFPSKEEKDNFYNQNCLEGSDETDIDLGLYYQNKLVACLSFKKQKDNKWILTRYATSCNIINGFNKLLNYFKEHYQWDKIIAFVDRRYSQGKRYLENGFQHIRNTTPNYYYTKGYTKINPNELNESVENYYRIYDCGHMKFELKND